MEQQNKAGSLRFYYRFKGYHRINKLVLAFKGCFYVFERMCLFYCLLQYGG
nr:hypothetical protein [uncultured bacterium]